MELARVVGGVRGDGSGTSGDDGSDGASDGSSECGDYRWWRRKRMVQ